MTLYLSSNGPRLILKPGLFFLTRLLLLVPTFCPLLSAFYCSQGSLGGGPADLLMD